MEERASAEPVVQPAEPDETGEPGALQRRDETTLEQPGKLLRIAMMIREMLEEARRAPLDEDAREHLAGIHTRVLDELKSGLSGTLSEELERITLPLSEDGVPSDAELRIAHAQLLGWLEGLFQGIQAAIATQQMAMASQLEEMRRRMLPSGPGEAGPESASSERTPGQYL